MKNETNQTSKKEHITKLSPQKVPEASQVRSIGRSNIALVRRVTQRIKAQRNRPSFPGGPSYGNYSGIREEVIDNLPLSMFDTWEGAYSEINNIIEDSL